jgi:hypothetical protein
MNATKQWAGADRGGQNSRGVKLGRFWEIVEVLGSVFPHRRTRQSVSLAVVFPADVRDGEVE